MDKESVITKRSKIVNLTGIKNEATKIAEESRIGFGWVRADGAVCFGNECVVLKPNEQGKLQLTVKPSECGEKTGALLLEYLIKTAGKGVVIEIPSEVQESK